MWERLFAERELVWTPRVLVTPAAAGAVEEELARIDAGKAHGRRASDPSLLSTEGDELLADARDALLRGALPAVDLRPSAVGFGLFAFEPLPARQLIGTYAGLLTPIHDVAEQGAYAHEAWPDAPVAIDAAVAGNHTRFLNHGAKPNIATVQCIIARSWHVLYVTSRAIAADEELLVDYGKEYWRRRKQKTL